MTAAIIINFVAAAWNLAFFAYAEPKWPGVTGFFIGCNLTLAIALSMIQFRREINK